MLESTFQHIPGVGATTEHRLWSSGCTSWEHILERDWGLPRDTYRRLKAGVLESRARLDVLDHKYFRQALPSSVTWRAYDSFRDHAAYIDIETTGLSAANDEVTTVCVASAKGATSYVSGDNLGRLKRDLKGFKYLVSFNGARFDLPFLSQNLGIRFDQIHLDLLYPLRRLGYSGGLKGVEAQLGLERDTDGVTGYDAVRLWRSYKGGREVEVAGKRVAGDEALELLVAYNRDDTVNLMELADITYSMMRERDTERMLS